MAGVGALYNGQVRWRDGHGRAKLLPGAEVGTVGNGLRIVERQQHLRQKPLVIHIFAGLGQPLLRPLLRAGKEIVHVEHAAPQLTLQPRWGEPADIGKAVAMLLRGDLAYSTGQVINVDGGMEIGRL